MKDLPSGSFRLEGYIDVPENRVDAVRAALVEHIRLTREEDGCIFFNVTPSKDVPGRFLVSEAFVDESAFKFHQERSASSSWARTSKDIPRNFETWIAK